MAAAEADVPARKHALAFFAAAPTRDLGGGRAALADVWIAECQPFPSNWAVRWATVASAASARAVSV